MRRTAQIAAITILATLFSSALISTFPGSTQLADGSANAAGALAERLGPDDGYALAIHFSGDLQGSLDTCG